MSTYDAAMKAIDETAESHREILERLKASAQDADELQAKVPAILPSWCAGQDEIMIYLTVGDDNASDLTEVLRELGRRGYRRHRKDERPQYSAVIFEMHRGEYDRIEVYAMLKGSRCRFVQTGTSEVPVMELRCTDGSAIEEAIQGRATEVGK